jgi:hypothetical protein
MSIDFGALVSRISKFTVDHSPSILTTLGVAGAVSSTIMAARAAWEASDLIRLKEADDEARGQVIEDSREVLKDRVRLVWPLFVPPTAMLTATVACVIGAQRVNSRRAAGLAAMYTLAEKTHTEYVDKVREKIGERKEEAVRDEIAQDRINESWHDGVYIHGDEDAANSQIFLDKFSGRYFRSDVESIRSVLNDFNKGMLHDGFLSLAEFYEFLGLPAASAYYNVGWHLDKEGFVDVRFSGAVLPNGQKPCMVMEFKEEPKPNFSRFH